MSCCEACGTECEPLAASSGHILQLQHSDLSLHRKKVVEGIKWNRAGHCNVNLMWCKTSLPCRRKPAGNRPVSSSDSAAGHCAAPELQTHTSFRGGERGKGLETQSSCYTRMRWEGLETEETWWYTVWSQNEDAGTDKTKSTTEKTSARSLQENAGERWSHESSTRNSENTQ